MTQPLTRREALLRVVALPLAAALPAGLAACSRGPKCDDTGALSPDDRKIRTEIAGYAEKSPDPAKRCLDCVQYVPGASGGCGTCKVVKGPIHPEATCKLFAAKPT
jgi:hypothetical protein